MICFHLMLFLILSVATIQGADSQKINFPFSIVLANGSTTEIHHEIDLTKKEKNTKKTFGDLFAKSQTRGTPWAITTLLISKPSNFKIDYIDLVELVRTYGKYSKNDFRSFEKTDKIICAAEQMILNQLPSVPLRQRKVLYNNQELPQFQVCLQYRLTYDNSENIYNIKVTDLQAILAIALCNDFVPAGALQFGFLKRQITDRTDNHIFEVAENFWNPFISTLPSETLTQVSQQFAKAYPK